MLDKLQRVLGTLCRDYNDKTFLPILEADVAAYLFYLWVSEFGEAKDLHLDTRVYQKLESRFDFVVGKIEYGAGRPCITKPELVAELKAFPYGFTNEQHSVHYSDVIERDLPKLQSIKNPANFRYEILFDEDDYLRGFDRKSNGLRIERVIKRRDELDRKIVVVYFRKTAKGLEYKFI